ncbi:hypothetical protein [Planococcus plakortidis]|uniref:hypothetical protein n=1 Tax=Planococcus plakortidis TaxID=1038856 RepID=UPI00385BE1F5
MFPFFSFEEAKAISNDAYVTSFLQSPSDDGFAMSRYYLHNDEKTEEHIQALYSRLFGIIETSDSGQ